MTTEAAIKILRDRIGDRNDHHMNCRKTQSGGKCDCYAEGRERAHQALDVLLNSLGLKESRHVPN